DAPELHPDQHTATTVIEPRRRKPGLYFTSRRIAFAPAASPGQPIALTIVAMQLFREHPRSWRENLYVYPVISRRSRGLSIGINLNPDKSCNFDCLYCCVDRTVPPAVRKVDLAVVRAELDHLLGLAVSGRLFEAPPFDQTPP